MDTHVSDIVGLFHYRNHRLFAIAGYPLSERTLGPGCVLTCNWHKWPDEIATSPNF
jgi:hypothetical protein